jgi:hypothetical protein
MTQNQNLAKKLQSEVRKCDQCRYVATNPFYERCPRCNALLPKLELFCNGCLHISICPALAEQEGKSVKEAGEGS